MLRLKPILVLLTLLCPAGASGQMVRGRVVDANTRTPLPTTVVALLDDRDSVVVRAIVDDSGRFALLAPVRGTYRISAERIGYASEALGPVRLAGGVTDVQIRLDPVAIPLDALIVATEAQIAALDRVGYYERQRVGTGKFVDRRTIELRNPVRTPDLFRGMPGVRVVATPNSGDAVLLRGGMSASFTNALCPPAVWLDGIAVQGDATGFDWRILPPTDIEAIEVYRSPSEAPAQYGGANSGCGIILVWTRKGGR